PTCPQPSAAIITSLQPLRVQHARRVIRSRHFPSAPDLNPNFNLNRSGARPGSIARPKTSLRFPTLAASGPHQLPTYPYEVEIRTCAKHRTGESYRSAPCQIAACRLYLVANSSQKDSSQTTFLCLPRNSNCVCAVGLDLEKSQIISRPRPSALGSGRGRRGC